MGEVENYQRIELGKVADGEVSAGVAVDLAHLVAELMENAAQFSPPNTPVDVTGRMRKGPDRYEVSIADGGMGLGDKLDGANELLANPPELGLGMGRSLGFMVIGRLAQRLGATVTLEAKQGGGTTAVVSIPTSLFLSSGRGGARGRGKASRRRARKSGAAPAPAEEPKAAPKSATEDVEPEPEPTTASTEHETESTQQPAAASTTLEKLLGLNASVLDRANDVDAAPDDWASTSPFGEDEAGEVELEPEPVDEDGTAGGDGETWTPPKVTTAPPGKLAEAVPTGEAFEDGVASLLDEPEDGDAPSRGLRDDQATSAGLQKRQRGASKVPIGEGRPVAASTRNPDEVRSMLSRYREGLMGGKQDAREDAGGDAASADGTDTEKGRKGAR